MNRKKSCLTCGYRSSLVILLLLAVGALFFAAYDVVSQALKQGRSFNTLLILGISYLTLVVLATSISLFRLFRVKHFLKRLRFATPPASRKDFPNILVFDHVRHNWTKSADVRAKALPVPEKCRHAGWGTLGSTLDGIRFRTSIIKSIQLVGKFVSSFTSADGSWAIESAALLRSAEYSRQEDQPIRSYLIYLSSPPLQLFPLRLAMALADGYDFARFSTDTAILEHDYIEFMKIVSVVLESMGYYNGPVTRKEDLSRISSAAEEEESFGVFSLSRDALLVRQSTEIASSIGRGGGSE